MSIQDQNGNGSNFPVHGFHVIPSISTVFGSRFPTCSSLTQGAREAFASKLSVAPSQLQFLTTATTFEELEEEVQASELSQIWAY